MKTDDYTRRAVLVRVVDGDTVILDIDCGFRMWNHGQSVRVLGIDCPEMRGPSIIAGTAAKQATETWFQDALLGNFFFIRTHLDKTDSFGRVLAEIWNVNDSSLADYLISTGHAIPRKRGYVEDGRDIDPRWKPSDPVWPTVEHFPGDGHVE